MSRLIDADALLESLISCNGLGRKSCELVVNVIKEQPTAYGVDKVLDACAEVVSKIPGLCGRHCPIDCHYGTEQSCKESWKLYLKEHLKEG